MLFILLQMCELLIFWLVNLSVLQIAQISKLLADVQFLLCCSCGYLVIPIAIVGIKFHLILVVLEPRQLDFIKCVTGSHTLCFVFNSYSLWISDVSIHFDTALFVAT